MARREYPGGAGRDNDRKLVCFSCCDIELLYHEHHGEGHYHCEACGADYASCDQNHRGAACVDLLYHKGTCVTASGDTFVGGANSIDIDERAYMPISSSCEIDLARQEKSLLLEAKQHREAAHECEERANMLHETRLIIAS
jgi:hypothetical protein